MKSTLILFLPVLFFHISCKQAKPADQPEKEATVSKYQYPALGNQDLTALYAAADKADFIFYDHPFSINQEDAKSAKNSVLYISPAPVEVKASCKPLGRLTWVADGKIFREADFYMDSVCQYFIFMTNNQPVAANAMSKSGVDFFNLIFDKLKQQGK